VYVTAAGWKVALDWEQPPVTDIVLRISNQAREIPCLECGLASGL